MKTQMIDSVFNAEATLLDLADILRSTGALVAEEAKHVPSQKRLEFERQTAARMNEVALCLQDFVVNLGQVVGVYSKGNWEESKRRWRPLRMQSERVARRVGLMQASDPIEIQIMLQWMVEQGHMEEVRVLRNIREMQVNWDEKTIALFDLAEQRIKQRVNGTELELQDSTSMLDEGEALRSLEVLLQSYFNRSADEREETFAETVISLNSLALCNWDVFEPRGSLDRTASSPLLAPWADYAIQLLVEALRDPRPAVRREAAAALGQWGDETAVESLVQMVARLKPDENDSVRRSCIGALGRIGGPRAVEALITAAEQDPIEGVRRDAISGLHELLILEELLVAAEQNEISSDSLTPVHAQQYRAISAVEAVLAAMQRISYNPRESESLKRQAQSLLVDRRD